MKTGYNVRALSTTQLLAAAHDVQTWTLPHLVPVGGGQGTSMVAWRDASEPADLRLAGAAVIIERFGPAIDALQAAGWGDLPGSHQRRLGTALRERPGGVAQLLAELDVTGTSLREFMDRSMAKLPTPPPKPRNQRRDVWTDRAIADLTRRGFAWNERKGTLSIPVASAAALESNAETKLVVLGQPIAVIQASSDRATFIATVPAGSNGVPLHAHEEVDQLEVLTSGSVRFALGTRSYAMNPGGWLAVPRMTPHMFVPLNAGASITSVVQGAGVGKLLDFFRAFDGTPEPESLPEPDRRSLMNLAKAAFPKFGIRRVALA